LNISTHEFGFIALQTIYGIPIVVFLSGHFCYIFHGTDWTQSNFKPQSMKIPGGIIVHLFDPQHARFGPYKGPATITKVDGNGPGSTVSRIEIQRIY